VPATPDPEHVASKEEQLSPLVFVSFFAIENRVSLSDRRQACKSKSKARMARQTHRRAGKKDDVVN